MVPSIAFTDRSGNTEALIGIEHESIASVLRRNRIPTASVIVFSDGRPISENTLLAQGVQYTAEQIEGFDLAAIREKYTHLEAPVEPETAYVKRRLLVSRTGEMLVETARQSVDSVVDYVERTVYKTCERFQLLDAFQDRPSDGHRVGRWRSDGQPVHLRRDAIRAIQKASWRAFSPMGCWPASPRDCKRRRLRPELVLREHVGYEGLVARHLAIRDAPEMHRRHGEPAVVALRAVGREHDDRVGAVVEDVVDGDAERPV
jgi:hypothetical protein